MDLPANIRHTHNAAWERFYHPETELLYTKHFASGVFPVSD